jgi:elongation factor P--beta-lysine ligase
LTDGPDNDLLKACYSSPENLFKNPTEMIMTLAAVYHNDNQGSKVREKFRMLEYDLADKIMDIYQFICTVNSLANIAGITKAKCKPMLFEHIPADFVLRLLHDSKDPTISYDDFAGRVPVIAEAKQCAYDK